FPRLMSISHCSTGSRPPVLIRVAKQGSRTTVIWNPWIEKSRRMADFGPYSADPIFEERASSDAAPFGI
ncbi:MAG: hypothetical protein KDJ65_27920, partial [Anaerolineae bacterium]|nr:hypothetical protein [Anaerolineae bacterium]